MKNPELFEERTFVYTSDSIQPSDYRALEEGGWKTVRRSITLRKGQLPVYTNIIRRPLRERWPKDRMRRTP